MHGDELSPISRIRDQRSVWWAAQTRYSPYSPGPPLQENLDCDVAIVGGGFTGTSAAYHFARRFPERRIALFEAHTLANGASGRSGGLVLNGMNGPPTPDLELTRRVFDTTRRGIDALEARIREHALDARFQRDGYVEVYTDPRRADDAAREVERLRGAGIPLQFIHGRELERFVRFEGARGAVLDPTAGRLDGVSLIHAMRPLLRGLGVSIYERTPVLGIREGQVHTLSVPGARVRAKTLVLATNAYTPRLGYFRSGVVPLHSHVLATEALPPRTWRELGWHSLAGFSDDRDRLAYGSMTLGGELVFGGGSNAAYAYRFGGETEFRGSAERAFAAIERRLHQYFSGVRTRGVRVAHRWTGTIALTMDRVCTMGVLGRYRNVLYALGYSGHGITLANLAGEVLADLYAGEDTRWRGLPFFEHQLPFVPPEPFRWLGYQLYTSLIGRLPRMRRS